LTDVLELADKTGTKPVEIHWITCVLHVNCFSTIYFSAYEILISLFDFVIIPDREQQTVKYLEI
jgi:hypothetical protein